MTDRPFFDDEDLDVARRYVDGTYQPGAFDPIDDTSEIRDMVATASVASAKHYMQQSQSTRSQAGKSFRIFPAMIKTMSPNAFAGACSGLHICGIHAGLFAMVHEVCYFTMAQANVFQEVGDAKNEQSPRYPNGEMPAFWLIDHTISGTEVSANSFADAIVPTCPHRYLFAIHLTLLMLRSIWFHETAHCVNGHVDYLHKSNADFRLNEVNDPKMSLVELEQATLVLPPKRLFPALELDADRTSLYWTYRTQLDDAEIISEIAAYPKPLRLKMALFAAYLMTFLFEQINNRVAAEEPLTHPDSMTRLRDMIRTDVSPNFRPVKVRVLG